MSSIPLARDAGAKSSRVLALSQALLFPYAALAITPFPEPKPPLKASLHSGEVTQLPALPVLPSTSRFPASCLAALSIYKWKRKPDYFYKTEGEARGSVSFLFLPVASNFLTRVFYFQNFVLHKHRRPFSKTRATSGNFQCPFRHSPRSC